MTTTTIRVSEPRELLAYLPYRLGFRPRESLVVASVRGARGRIGLVARVDLDEVQSAAAARSLARHLWRDGAEQAVVVVYAEPARREGRWRADVLNAAAAMTAALAELVGPSAVWVVDADRYRCLDCEDLECCPTEGRPLSELASTQVSAHMVLAGATVSEHRGELTEVRPASAAARHNVRRVEARWARRRELDSAAGEAALARWRLSSLDSLAAALDARAAGETIRARELGRLSAALEDVLVRDAVIVGLVGSLAEMRAALAGPPGLAGERVGEGFGRLLESSGEAPERDALEAGLQVLRELVAHAPQGAHAPALSVLATLAWWLGDGVSAGSWLEKAVAADPEYRLARLLAATLEAGVPPGWARRSTARGPGLR